MHWGTVTRLCLQVRRGFAAIKARTLICIAGSKAGWRKAAAKGVHIIKLGSSVGHNQAGRRVGTDGPPLLTLAARSEGKGQLGIFLCGLMISLYWFATQLQIFFFPTHPTRGTWCMFETSSAHTLTPITFFNRSGQGLAWSWRDLARSRPSLVVRHAHLTGTGPMGLYRRASPASGSLENRRVTA